MAFWKRSHHHHGDVAHGGACQHSPGEASEDRNLAEIHSRGYKRISSLGEVKYTDREIPRALTRALVVTLIFMLVEVIGGYFSNSLALLSDAGHMLADAGAILLSLFAFWVSRRPSTPTMSFGYHRAEILGALASGLAIWMIAGLLIYEAILRISSPPEVKGGIVVGVASVGLVANLVNMWMLHSAKQRNLNVKAAYLHLLADCLGSVGAVIAGAVIVITGWRPIDLIVSVFFAVLMLVSSWELVRESVGVLMESVPPTVDAAQVRKDLQVLPQVQDVHDLHIWTVSSGRLAMCVHLISNGSEQRVLDSANRLLQDKYGIIHTTIQIEHPDKFESSRCYDCSSA